MITFLSYFINEQTPLYGGEKAIFFEKRNQIVEGASSNTEYLKFPNHTGTHIDFPKHFSDSGKTINDYLPSFWKFNRVYTIDYPASQKEILSHNILEDLQIPEDTEFIIINTGFGKYRNEENYWKNNPGLAPELAGILKARCPNLRVVGFDFISLSSFQNRMLGREAHKEFLIKNNILIIEDMNLTVIKDKNVKSIIALPLMIEEADGVPVTIIAEYE